MNAKVANAIEELDAAIMNGDTFHDPDVAMELISYLESWLGELTGEGEEDDEDL